MHTIDAAPVILEQYEFLYFELIIRRIMYDLIRLTMI